MGPQRQIQKHTGTEEGNLNSEVSTTFSPGEGNSLWSQEQIGSCGCCKGSMHMF